MRNHKGQAAFLATKRKESKGRYLPKFQRLQTREFEGVVREEERARFSYQQVCFI